MLSQRDLRKAVRHGERELRAAGGDMLSQLNPRNILRDTRDLALKFTRDEVLQAYVAPRIWGVLVVVLVFVLVSTVCSIDVMMRFARFAGSFRGLTLPFGALVWAGGVIGQIYVFAIWLEGLAARNDREERGVRLDIPPGFLAYLKYSRALVPWILVVSCVALPLIIMAPRAPLVALLLLLVSVIAPFLFKKIAA